MMGAVERIDEAGEEYEVVLVELAVLSVEVSVALRVGEGSRANVMTGCCFWLRWLLV